LGKKKKLFLLSKSKKQKLQPLLVEPRPRRDFKKAGNKERRRVHVLQYYQVVLSTRLRYW
jgi:hypothetical protein